eukprot:UN08255
MKEKQNVHVENVNISLPLTKEFLDRYQIFDIENIASKIVKINEMICSENEEFCLILDDKNNDGLLWKLLLMNKYKYCGLGDADDNNKFVQERVSMYKQWFNMDIAKWIYHLGYWTLFPSISPQITRACTRRRVSLIQNLNNISTTHSQPNVARRSTTMNTSSPTVSSASPSVVDSLELYLPTNS